ncbi:hypothetical protein D3C80_2034120 [compost metagenome]
MLGNGSGLELIQRLDGLGIHQLDHFVRLDVFGQGDVGTESKRSGSEQGSQGFHQVLSIEVCNLSTELRLSTGP